MYVMLKARYVHVVMNVKLIAWSKSSRDGGKTPSRGAAKLKNTSRKRILPGPLP